MCICDGCGKLIDSKFYYCPWCGYSKVDQEKEDSLQLRLNQLQEKQKAARQSQIERMEAELDALERELSVLVLSTEMAR